MLLNKVCWGELNGLENDPFLFAREENIGLLVFGSVALFITQSPSGFELGEGFACVGKLCFELKFSIKLVFVPLEV